MWQVGLLGLLPWALVGCGFQPISRSGDTDGGILSTCTSTTLRGFEPLGNASAMSSSASLALAGDQMGAAWEEAAATDTADGTVYFARVDQLGQPGAARSLGAGQSPVLVRSAAGLTLLYRQGTALLLQRLTDDGVPMGTAATVAQVTTTGGFVARWNGSQLGILISGIASDAYEVYFLRADATGKPLDPVPVKVPQSGINSLQTALDWTGSRWALAWTDVRSGNPAVYAALFDSDGLRRSDDALLSAGQRGSYPAVAAQYDGGTEVCYAERETATTNQIWCSRLDSMGAVTARVQISSNYYDAVQPAAVAHGKYTWVAFIGHTGTSDPGNVAWQFLDDAGSPAGSSPFDSQINYAFSPHVQHTDQVLYELHYAMNQPNHFEAEVLTVNCF
jgi:hypothetical protein